MIAKFFRFIGKVVWVNANAVTTNKTRPKSKSIPLSIHTFDNFIGIYAHTVEYHSKLIHKSNVNITLTVFNNLNSFSCFNIGNGVCTNFDNKIINSFDLFKRLVITSRNNFLDIFKSVNLVTRVNSFGRIANLKIIATL